MSSNKNLIAVYGSLRVGQYNFQRFEKHLEYLKTIKIKGYNLFSLGAYPGINKSEDDYLKVDLLIVDDLGLQRISAMELGAGYREEIIFIEDTPCTLYVYNYPPKDNNDIIPNGDWVNFVKNKN